MKQPSHIERGMGDGEEDLQARFLLAEIGGIHGSSIPRAACIPGGITA